MSARQPVTRWLSELDRTQAAGVDLTQLVLGVDRDSDRLRHLFGERNPAVTASIAALLRKAKKSGTHTGLCGQAPSDHPEFARLLVEHGIDSISVSPDSFLAVKREAASAESEWTTAAGSTEAQTQA